MDTIDRAAAAFREAITAAILPLQTTRELRLDEFARLEKTATEVVALLKGHELVSKAVLKEFYLCARILRNEAPYFAPAEQTTLENAAAQLETLFDMILRDEVPGERVPGVPRVF